ncbi:hypothetical protein MOF27_07360 [Priestia megaterium]|uniref:hypothetical protein n=1 Tax=Priestia megaterium TaxID=1404 RepID=UPI00227E0CA1|nr:hypothetical protein [Priestia megaterium]MCY9017250.1 hypothetical protein [Priestia megaterium]
MIKVIFESDSLSVVDWFQIISAIATALAAGAALVTALQNRKANKQLENERHTMVKPSFRIRSIYEKRPEKVIEFSVYNVGFERHNPIVGEWAGSEGVSVTIKEHFKAPNDFDQPNLDVILNYAAGWKNNEVKGDLILSYKDVLGKDYKESIYIEIEGYYDEVYEEHNPVLKSKVVSKYFTEKAS